MANKDTKTDTPAETTPPEVNPPVADKANIDKLEHPMIPEGVARKKGCVALRNPKTQDIVQPLPADVAYWENKGWIKV